jgi:hypothetical protein
MAEGKHAKKDSAKRTGAEPMGDRAPADTARELLFTLDQPALRRRPPDRPTAREPVPSTCRTWKIVTLRRDFPRSA